MGEFIGVVGGIAGLIGAIVAAISLFWIRQQTSWLRNQTNIADHQLFIAVAKDIHERYSALYPTLGTLRPGGFDRLTDAQREAISRYVNLCAEEFLWKQKGIVQPEIWEVWEYAIKDKFCNTIIGEVWTKELCRDKYYKGFLEFIDGILKN